MGVELQGSRVMGFIYQHRGSRLFNFVPDFYCIYAISIGKDRVSVLGTFCATDVCMYSTQRKIQLIARAVSRRPRWSSMPFLNHDSIPATVLSQPAEISLARICRVWQGNIVSRKNARSTMRKVNIALGCRFYISVMLNYVKLCYFSSSFKVDSKRNDIFIHIYMSGCLCIR